MGCTTVYMGIPWPIFGTNMQAAADLVEGLDAVGPRNPRICSAFPPELMMIASVRLEYVTIIVIHSDLENSMYSTVIQRWVFKNI